MKQSKIIMGMPISIEIVDKKLNLSDFDKVFSYFQKIDMIFSTYKQDSEISKINKKEINNKNYSNEVKDIFKLAEKYKIITNGYFNIRKNGLIDPSGIVKGWSIEKAHLILKKSGYKNFYIDAGGDIMTYGLNSKNIPWRVGIKNPFNQNEIIKTISLSNLAIATSGLYIRGAHIYNPNNKLDKLNRIVSVSVIGKFITEVDVFATAAFAMQEDGIRFIENQNGVEAYFVRDDKTAIYTSGFGKFILN